MNYDRVIVELLDRISLLEEKTERLEKIIAQQSSFNATGTAAQNIKMVNLLKAGKLIKA